MRDKKNSYTHMNRINTIGNVHWNLYGLILASSQAMWTPVEVNPTLPYMSVKDTVADNYKMTYTCGLVSLTYARIPQANLDLYMVCFCTGMRTV